MNSEKYVRWKSEESINNSKEPLYGNEIERPSNVPTWTSARYVLAYMAFFGFFNVYALRVNLSVAIVSMANTSDTHNASNECPVSHTNSTPKEGEFNWSSNEKALVLGAFFYGYICTQLIGGILASKFGGKYLFGCGVLCTTVFTLLTPVAARTSFALLIATRVVEGLGEGVTFPAMHAMWGVWVPPLERSKLVSLGYAGCHFGTFIAQPISGILCNSDFLGGWPSVFYVFGTLGLIWCLMWFIVVHNKPRDHPRISAAELQYIESTVPQEQTEFTIPWMDILTSRHVWAISCAHFANNWGFYTLLTCLPMYLKYVLRFDMTTSGIISALPFFVMWVSINLSGFVCDYLREKRILNTTQARKVFNSIGLIGPAIFLVAAGYVGCNNTLIIAFICIATAFNGCTFPGFNSNHIDIASRYSGILMGITNTFATIPGFVSPIVVEKLTGDNETREQWRIVFFIACGIYIVGTILFILLASGEEQEWNRPQFLFLDDTRQPLLRDEGFHEKDISRFPHLNHNANSNSGMSRHRVSFSSSGGYESPDA
uniref:sialin-like n=1 Tax=Styela clava TaxID=7725 RepID=UPI00193A9CB5|nr:sialin-like [Styela clava]